MQIMKNSLLALLTLLASGGLWAEDEFPIELTCEFAEVAFNINVAATEENTWTKLLTDIKHSGGSAVWWANKSHKDKKVYARKNSLSVDSKNIYFAFPNGAFGNVDFYINRFTGKIRAGNYSGECYKGFKEYKERKF